MAHELIRDFRKKNGSKLACIKIDLHKAFDRLNREFIYFLMHCMKFPPIWINWIRECISSPTFSIMVNGTPQGYFGNKETHSPLIFLCWLWSFYPFI